MVFTTYFMQVKNIFTLRLIILKKNTIYLILLFSFLSAGHVNNSFEPLKVSFQKAHLDVKSGEFDLKSPQPLFFQIDYVRNGDNKDDFFALSINGKSVKNIYSPSRFIDKRIRFILPTYVFSTGRNQLAVEISKLSTIDIKLKNYLGGNPNFPQAYIRDDSASDLESESRVLRAVANFITIFLSIVTMAKGFSLVAERVFPYSQMESSLQVDWYMLIPLCIPGAVAAYSFFTPVFIIFPFESIIGVVGIYFLLAIIFLLLLRWRRRLFPPIVFLIYMFGAGEVFLRGYNYFYPSHIFFTESPNRYRGAAFGYYQGFQLNSRGFHDIEYPLNKPEKLFRIAAIGDSFAYGVVPYRYNFLTLLEDKLNEKRRSYEVLNMGISGIEPKAYFSLLVEEGLSFNPDRVITFFYIGNDFEVAKKKNYEYSLLASLFYYMNQILKFPNEIPSLKLGSIAQGKDVPPPFPKYLDDKPTLDRKTFLYHESSRSAIFIKDESKRKVQGAPFIDGANTAFSYIEKMNDLCLSRGIDYWTVLIPMEAQVNEELQGDIVRSHGLRSDDFDFMIPNKWLIQKHVESGIRVIDLTEAFRGKPQELSLYKPQDTHWNIKGNQLAANILFKTISANPSGMPVSK
jgi:hypothetical protein